MDRPWVVLVVTAITLVSSLPHEGREDLFPLQFFGGSRDSNARQEYQRRQERMYYEEEDFLPKSEKPIGESSNNLPIKTTTFQSKSTSNDNNNLGNFNFKEAYKHSKGEGKLQENDPTWWNEYPIPFVGTTSNSDSRWNRKNDRKKLLEGSKRQATNSQSYEKYSAETLATTDDVDKLPIENFENSEEIIGHKKVVFGEANEQIGDTKIIEPDFGPVALPSQMKYEEESPPLRKIQKFVHLSSVNTKDINPSKTKGPVVTSMLDMISTAKSLRNKRPAFNGADPDALIMEEYPNADLADNGSFLGFDQMKSLETGAVVDVQEEEDWKEHLIIDWDPAKTPLTTAILGSVMLFIILVVVVLALRVHCRNREKLSQEWIRHPLVMPTTSTSGPIQPHVTVQTNQQLLKSEPVRIKAKGLLERRGSNTSLTIDLPSNCICPATDGPSPTIECTPEEYLNSAGNRMSRRQLRQCLYDPRALHAEFWQIPTNHPDKSLMSGWCDKNRYRTILPNEETRVAIRAPERDQYINANYVRGYDGEEKAFIATQGPLVNTVEDLWMMVLQEKCPAIVMITRLKEKGRVKCEPYVPSYTASYNGLQVVVKQIIQKNGYTIRQIQIQRGDQIHTTLHYWFTSWPDHKAPSSAKQLLSLAAEIQETRKHQSGPVAVHCSAGIGRTGCFIAISNCMQQLLEEDCIDILATICQMRLDRGGMVQTPEQYEFIHRALTLYESSLPMCGNRE